MGKWATSVLVTENGNLACIGVGVRSIISGAETFDLRSGESAGEERAQGKRHTSSKLEQFEETWSCWDVK